jgi:hypothetical protein
MTTFLLKSRPAQVRHKALAAARKQSELIKDVAALMGTELNISQLALDLQVPIAKVYANLKDII